MRFRLFYEGDLLSSGNNSKRPGHKHEICRTFRKQLEELWRVHPNLSDWTESGGYRTRPEREKIAEKHVKWGIRWVPLVAEDDFAHCSIEILMLRPGKQGRLIVDTDIDNRLKTLFDAMQSPKSDAGLGDPIAEEDLFGY